MSDCPPVGATPDGYAPLTPEFYPCCGGRTRHSEDCTTGRPTQPQPTDRIAIHPQGHHVFIRCDDPLAVMCLTWTQAQVLQTNLATLLPSSGPDYAGAVAAVRRLHWPSPDRDSSCDCYDGLQDCPTIAALDKAGCV